MLKSTIRKHHNNAQRHIDRRFGFNNRAGQSFWRSVEHYWYRLDYIRSGGKQLFRV